MGLLGEEEFPPGMSPGESGSMEPTVSYPPAPLTVASPALSEDETGVLEALSTQHRLTSGQLMRATSLDGEELRLALGGLHMKGLIARLQTVIESYCRRHPRSKAEG